jgi:hypothetical protein
MTAHDEQTKTTTSPTADDDSPARQEYSSAGTAEPATGQPAQSVAAEPSAATTRSDTPAAETESAETATGTSTEQSRTNSLFADDPSGLRSRWDDVQAAFVDDPRECVQKADTLVAEVVDQLTNGFSEVRSRLEAQWSRGEQASTEDLRVALKRYREFFQRLLSV